ncbi:MAG: haloacid dehalogenase [Anaerolineae bacterium]|nr:haloacid dehalogenase [Anaerolineae bacterium]
MSNLDALEPITEQIRAVFEAKTAARDAAINQSRTVIRHCANAIRAIHRHEWDTAHERLEQARQATDKLRADVADYPDLYHSGYTQDALKEYVEAHATYALVREEALPTLDSLDVEPAAYLNGLAEAASELRRQILDIIRRGHSDEAERLLVQMDTIYGILMGFDFHDSVTGGLRRRLDSLRGVLERTRGDVTTSLRQQQLQAALRGFEQRIGLDSGNDFGSSLNLDDDEEDQSQDRGDSES